MAVTPGDVIAERYRLERLIGEGGMGSVWAATHVVTRKPVALKFLKAEATSELGLKRFLREARAASVVRHPAVVGVHDILQHEKLPVMVLDLLDGESLGAKLLREHRIPLPEFARLMLPVVSAVGTAHSMGVVHRDLKPDNVFLHRRPEGDVEPRVLDFGIAKLSATEGEAAATAHLTSTGAVMGTPYYMSPEQVFGEKDLDHRSDVWAMGVIAYECLSGKKPIDGANIGQLFKAIVHGDIVPIERVAPDLPEAVTAAINHLLRSKREERANDLRELYEVLKPYASVSAIDFGTAVAPVIVQSSPHASSGPLEPSASGADAPPPAVTGAGVSQTVGDQTVKPPLQSWKLPLGIAATLGGGLMVALLFVRSRPAPATREEGAPSSSPAAEALPAVTLAPATSVAVLPVASSAAAEIVDAGPGQAALPGASKARRKVEAATASALSAASPPPSPPPSPPSPPPPAPAVTREKGQVVEKAPF